LEGEIINLEVPPNTHTHTHTHTHIYAHIVSRTHKRNTHTHTHTHKQRFLQGDREERAPLKRQITDLSRDNSHLRSDLASLREDVAKRQKHGHQEVEGGKSASTSTDSMLQRLLVKQMERQSSAAEVIDAMSNVVVAAAGQGNNKYTDAVVPVVKSASTSLRSGLMKLGNPVMKDMVVMCTDEELVTEMKEAKLDFGERTAVGAAFKSAKAPVSVV
jgi:hypothetical protein